MTDDAFGPPTPASWASAQPPTEPPADPELAAIHATVKAGERTLEAFNLWLDLLRERIKARQVEEEGKE